jgi:hypothetical protein
MAAKRVFGRHTVWETAMKSFAFVFVGATLGGAAAHVAAADAPKFGGEKTSWHGFDRYDFLMDETDFTVKPHKA